MPTPVKGNHGNGHIVITFNGITNLGIDAAGDTESLANASKLAFARSADVLVDVRRKRRWSASADVKSFGLRPV
jgi:hypothetical protein